MDDRSLEFSGLVVTIQKVKLKSNVKPQTIDKICLHNVHLTLQTRITNGKAKMVIEMFSSFNRHDIYMPLLKDIEIIATEDETITINMHESTSSFMFTPTTTRLTTSINSSYLELLQSMLSQIVTIKTPEKVKLSKNVNKDHDCTKENVISPNTGFPRKVNEKISSYAKMSCTSDKIATGYLHSNNAPAGKKVNKCSTPEKLIPSASDILNESQKRAFDSVKSGKNVFISGSAGTGKSFLIMQIIDYYNRLYGKSKVKITATTGAAAVQIGGTTIHRFSGLRNHINEHDNPEIILNYILKSADIINNWKEAKVLVIDEVSMLLPSTLEIIDLIARRCRGSDKIFGGVQVILVGDFGQLPPVIKDKKIVNKFCFQSKIWTELVQESIILDEIFRQKDDALFITILNLIRKGVGQENDLVKSAMMACFNRKLDITDGIVPIKLCTHNADVFKYNKGELDKLPSVAHDYHAEDQVHSKTRRTIPENQAQYLLDSCMAPKLITLKLDSQVILIKTIDSKIGLVNGTNGRIVAFEGGYPVVEFSNKVKKQITKVKFNDKLGDIEIVRNQLPISLGWAISIHKAQGVTVQKAELHLNNIFEPGYYSHSLTQSRTHRTLSGQLYVAISRVKHIEGLSIITSKPENIFKGIMADQEVLKFYNLLQP